MSSRQRPDPDAIAGALLQSDLECLCPASLEADGARLVARALVDHRPIYEPLLLGTATHGKRWYDWNVGFLIPHLNIDFVAEIVRLHRNALAPSEGVAWGLGEAGSDDPRIVDFLYYACEQCRDYDTWWCAADALEKLGEGDAVDLKKRTLRGEEWRDLDFCLSHLAQRAAIIGVLREARIENTESRIIPACRTALDSPNARVVQNAVWLLERLRVDDPATIEALLRLYEEAEDASHTLRPRIIEAFGQIAAPQTRLLLETAITSAHYFRNRAYAAIGLGRIGEFRSLPVLRAALRHEDDERVIRYISDAIYSIESPTRRMLLSRSRSARWPENGMIVDESNDWYAHPEIYETFSSAEDPLGVSLEQALTYLPSGANTVADLGAGTGRFAFFVAETRPDVASILAVDANEAMHAYLKQKVGLSAYRHRIRPVCTEISRLPCADESMDAVLSSWAFPSKASDLARSLAELQEVIRVLKPGGSLITVGWDESYRDELSSLWYRFVPEPDFRRETLSEWRRRRRGQLRSARNCHLTFVRRNIRVPLLFDKPEDAALVLGFLFGFNAGQWVSQQRRSEFSISVGITVDSSEGLQVAVKKLESELAKA